MHAAVIQETDWLQRGPHQQHHLFERLSLRGHQVTVLDYPILREHWPREPFYSPRAEWDNAARIYPGASIRLVRPATLSLSALARPSSMITHYRELERLIRRTRPDVIVTYALSTGLPALALARRYRIPLVFHVIDALHTIVPSPALQPIAHQVERILFQQADEVVVINDHLLDYAVRMGVKSEHARTLRTGVDLEHFSPEADGIIERRRLGIGRDEYVLLFMGWLYPFSGVREVAASLSDAPSGVRLIVVGDGDDYSHLNRIKMEKTGDRLILTGRVPYDRIPALVAAADVCLLPFHTVPATEHIVPIKLYEYMAAAKPVIASPLPGVVRDVGEGHGVVYAPTDDHVTVALSIRHQAQRLGALGRRFVESHCDWGVIADEFESLLLQHVGQTA